MHSPLSHALVRPPSDHFALGLTTAGLGPPDVALARAQHESYVRLIEGCGLQILRLEADQRHPDATFVEDTAIVTARGALLTRPGAESRRGEVAAVGQALAQFFSGIETIAAPGTLDGGDVCEADGHYFIGISARTNTEGARQLAAWLAARGYSSTQIDLRNRAGLLHLKSGLAHPGGRRLAAVDALADCAEFAGWEVLRVPAGEEYAANCIWMNGTIIAPAGFLATLAMLRTAGCRVVEAEVSEFRKMDGGLSCLSLRW